uniref:Uncharacterized protein n=1 Tax=Amphimedon queenslandica TaxID=400682 RepID=A0A1X7VHV7_AMPQE
MVTDKHKTVSSMKEAKQIALLLNEEEGDRSNITSGVLLDMLYNCFDNPEKDNVMEDKSSSDDEENSELGELETSGLVVTRLVDYKKIWRWK